ncbi:TPA: class I tRNA ligase family protein, partial [archaeon]|nr:class I tRNA ligase family protein [Candidatus Naiadarchaeales archaeon SRR2090153.bin1042]
MDQKFNLKQIEEKILKFWSENSIYKKVVQKNSKGPRFKYIDGPPYTTGAIHLGTAWNKVLKDTALRYKRFQGYNVRDQPGYDMHGLPIEVKVEEDLKLKNKRDIEEKIGVENFIELCRKFALDNLDLMNKQFSRLGVWMDWGDPYMTIKNS